METTTNFNLKAEALKNGAIWGAINIVIFLVTWYIMPSLMSSYIYAGITIVIGITLAVFFCIDLRKKAGGYWSFGEALWPIFAMFLTSMAIVFVFTVLFGKFIDPSYPVKMKELSLAKTEETYRNMGMDEETSAKAMEIVEESLDKQFSPTFSQAVTGFGVAAIMYFVGALIFALIFKKSNSNPFTPLNDEQVEVQ
ncbi:DUF4199 domain-containing protein [Pedobacter cryotolerans]|uniref:DUF4199 domain-containing protein n=1 Tax=Pedobacter cryotolerans TaxID=2571270 RepID=A0A4U1C7B6_9SPHI|nr:DUF4199 domain-containing protein [Pedobacter cryotolerans]TKB99311.1 DUF4199 domain-containing protein [Pedobacter cryotolerans]